MGGPSFKVTPAYLKKEHTIRESSYEKETSSNEGTTSTSKTTKDGKTTTVTTVKDGDRNFATAEQKTQEEAEQEAKKDDPQYAKSASYSKSWIDPNKAKETSYINLGERKKTDNDPSALGSWEGRADVLYAEGDISSGISFDIDAKKATLNVVNASGKVSVLHGEAAGEFKLGKWAKGILDKLFGESDSAPKPTIPAVSAGLMAARVGDPTSHGSPLVPGIGSVNVFIGGKPAWRALIDFHACPVVKGVVPDVGGVVLKGSPTVFINNMMAVRLADQVMEIPGGPNPIIMGEPTVFIGDGGGGGAGGARSQTKSEDKSQDLSVGGKATGDLLTAEADVKLGASGDFKKGEFAAQAKASAMAAVFKGSLSGNITIPIPFTEHALTLGGEVEGTALSAGAEAEASGGYSKDKGLHSKVGLKGALGLGVGVSFSMGFK